MTVYHLNDIDFNDNAADANGSYWYITEDIDGWDSPETRTQIRDRPGSHGAVTVEGFHGPRNLRVHGLCKAASANAYHVSRNYLQSQTNYLNRLNTTIFSGEEDVHRQISVVRSAAVRMRLVGVQAFEFDISLRADDPFKYSVTLHSEGLVGGVGEAIPNAGSVLTYPVITLNATGTPVISAGALEWRGTASIPSGTVIDMKRQTVMNGSTDHFPSFDLTSDWLWLGVGNTTVESNLAATIEWRDAWL